MHSRRNKKNLASRIVESTGILLSILLVLTAMVYAAAGWNPGVSPQAAPGAGNVELGLDGFWTKNGPAKIFYNGGDIGIGTSSPTAKLEVAGNIIANSPTENNHVATKNYVDAASVSSVSSASSSDGAPIVIASGENAFWVTSNGTACVKTNNVGQRAVINNGQPCGHGDDLGECLDGVCENIQRISRYTLGSCNNAANICYDDIPKYCNDLCGGTSRPTVRYSGDAQSNVCCNYGAWRLTGQSAYNIRVGGIICDCPW